MRCRYSLTVFLLSTGLSGCGALWVPSIGEVWDQDAPGTKLAGDEKVYGAKHWAEIPGEIAPDLDRRLSPVPASARIEYEVKKRVYCELRRAIRSADYYTLIQNDKKNKYDEEQLKVGVTQASGIPTDWVAQVSLTFTVDEDTSLNPGLSLITPMHNGVVNFAGEYFGTGSLSLPGIPAAGLVSGYPATSAFGPLTGIAQNFTFGFGATLSSTGTRIDKYNPYYTIADLLDPKPKGMQSEICDDPNEPHDMLAEQEKRFGISRPISSPLIVDELGISEWLLGSTMVNVIIPSSPPAPPSNGGPLASAEKSCQNPGKKQPKGQPTKQSKEQPAKEHTVVAHNNLVAPSSDRLQARASLRERASLFDMHSRPARPSGFQ